MKKYELEGNVTMVTNAAGKVAQHVGYYPYGEPWREPSGQPYLFGGKERMRDGALNEYDFGTRRYNPALALWTTPDPVIHDQYSPFTYCAGNPIRYIDPNGMEFTEQSKHFIETYLSVVENKKKNSAKELEKLNNKLAIEKSDKKRNKLNNKINKLKERLIEYENIKAEVANLETSGQVYNISHTSKYSNSSTDGTEDVTRSGTTFDFKTNRVEIGLGDNSLGSLAHELKHAYQFETGALSIGIHESGEPFYDITDEIEAYERGALFDQQSLVNSSTYSKLQKESRSVENYYLNGNYSADVLQRVANQNNCVFRWDGRTYTPIKRE